MTPEELAAASLELLPSSRQWIKHAMSEGYRKCMWGAIMEASVENMPFMDPVNLSSVSKKIADIIREQFPERIHLNGAPECPEGYWCTCGTYGNVIVNFNDHPRTRFTDVRMILEKAAAG